VESKKRKSQSKYDSLNDYRCKKALRDTAVAAMHYCYAAKSKMDQERRANLFSEHKFIRSELLELRAAGNADENDIEFYTKRK
jgi:hypothetical protein